MDIITCPLECLERESWLEKNQTFIMTLIGSMSALVGLILSYCLKSRCHTIKCGNCIECDRTPIQLNSQQIEIQTNT